MHKPHGIFTFAMFLIQEGNTQRRYVLERKQEKAMPSASSGVVVNNFVNENGEANELFHM